MKPMKPMLLISLAATGFIFSGLAIAAQSSQPHPHIVSQNRVSQNSTSFKISTPDLVKARNLARQAIEKRSGGLSRYRAEPAMHGPIDQAPLVENDNGTITFTFLGGPPAYKPPTRESVVTVNPNGWTVKVDYNGPVRNR